MKNLNEMTDEQLAVLYIGGNNAAFDILLERTKDGLFSYILYIVHNEDLANDIFQETFTKAIMSLQKGRYVPSGRFCSWLIRIAHNIIMDSYRHVKNLTTVDANPENDLSNLDSEELIGASREVVMSHEQILVDVKRIVEFLPPKQREVVRMRFFQNLSYKEIAETAGVSINTALGRMRYAIMNMRKLAKENNVQLFLE